MGERAPETLVTSHGSVKHTFNDVTFNNVTFSDVTSDDVTHLSAKYCVATSPIGSLESTTLAPLWWILSNLSYRIFHSASTIDWYSWKMITNLLDRGFFP